MEDFPRISSSKSPDFYNRPSLALTFGIVEFQEVKLHYLTVIMVDELVHSIQDVVVVIIIVPQLACRTSRPFIPNPSANCSTSFNSLGKCPVS